MQQRGMSNSVQVALLLPLAITTFLLLLQWSFVAWAEATAVTAAEEGAREAALYGGSEEQGRVAAQQAAANGALRQPTVMVIKSAQAAEVTVSGHAVTVLWPVRVSKQATIPVEKIA